MWKRNLVDKIPGCKNEFYVNKPWSELETIKYSCHQNR